MTKKLQFWVSKETLDFEVSRREQVIAEQTATIQNLSKDLERYKGMLNDATSDFGKQALKHYRLLETLEELIRKEHDETYE